MGEQHQHGPGGNGNIDWDSVFERIVSADARGNVAVEPVLPGGTGEDSIWALFPASEDTPRSMTDDHLHGQRHGHSHGPQVHAHGHAGGSYEPSTAAGAGRGAYHYSAPVSPVGQPLTYGPPSTADPHVPTVEQALWSRQYDVDARDKFPTVPLPHTSYDLSTYQHSPVDGHRRRATQDDNFIRDNNPSPQWPPPVPTYPFLPETSSWSQYQNAVAGPGPSSSIVAINNLMNDNNLAGPSRVSSTENTPLMAPPPTPIQVMPGTPGGVLDSEDKRFRNTLASAKFRAKRKKQVETVAKRIDELESEHADLAKDVNELRQENKFLREMVDIKYGMDKPPFDDTKPEDR